MKSPVIFQNKNGFLVMEALIAMSLMTMIIPAALFLSWSEERFGSSTQSMLDSLSSVSDVIGNGPARQVASSTILYNHEFGKSTCDLMPADLEKGFVSADVHSFMFSTSSDIGTSLAARNGFVYETTVPAAKTLPDFFIIDDRNPDVPNVVSSLVTGPGLAGVAVSGYYAYLANESQISQLRVVDIHDRSHPSLVAKLKLPAPEASATEPAASSIFYDAGVAYLGTQKWEGNEMNIIDVSNPLEPLYVSGFNVGSLVNAVYENGGFAYIASPLSNAQMDILDVRNPQAILDLSHVSPAGSGVLEGKSFSYDSGAGYETASATGTLYFARGGGGFDNPNQYELFSFNLAADPYAQNPAFVRNIPGGVYGMAYDDNYVFLASGDPSAGFQIWSSDFSKEMYSAALPSKPASLVCDHDRLYVALSSPAGFVTIIPH